MSTGCECECCFFVLRLNLILSSPSVFTHQRYTGMGFAIARILKICFANIGEVTDWIELNFDMCIANRHINISATGFVKIFLYC